VKDPQRRRLNGTGFLKLLTNETAHEIPTMPLAIPDNLAVFTTIYVCDSKLPILKVRHQSDEEGGSTWEFHANNGPYLLSDVLVVAMKEILDIDPSIATILDLPIDNDAVRSEVGGVWHIRPIENA
jgi:hypothetical protein